MVLVAGAGGEIQAARRDAMVQAPEAVDLYRVAGGVLDLAEQGAGLVVDIDHPVAEIPDVDGVLEIAEALGNPGEAPGRIERAARGEALDQRAAGGEDV